MGQSGVGSTVGLRLVAKLKRSSMVETLSEALHVCMTFAGKGCFDNVATPV